MPKFYKTIEGEFYWKVISENETIKITNYPHCLSIEFCIAKIDDVYFTEECTEISKNEFERAMMIISIILKIKMLNF